MYDSVNNSKRLEFSHATMATYTKHGKQPKGIIINNNLKCFTSFSERGVHVWHPETGEKQFQAEIQESLNKKAREDAIKKNINDGLFANTSKKGGGKQTGTRNTEVTENTCISCMCYSNKFHLYFACTKDFKLLVMNEYLNIVAELPLEVRLV